MSVYTANPYALIDPVTGAPFSAVGGGNLVGVLNDNSDSTYAEKDTAQSGSNAYFFESVSDPTIPTNEVLSSVQAFGRVQGQSTSHYGLSLCEWKSPSVQASVTVWSDGGGGGSIFQLSTPVVTTSPLTHLPAPEWTIGGTGASVFGVRIEDDAHAYGPTPMHTLKTWLVYTTVSKPLAPSGLSLSSGNVLIDSLTPTLSWTFSDVTTGTVTLRASSTYTRTLTVGAHNFQVGNDITVTDLTADYNGTGFKITAVTGTTISYVATTSVTESTADSGSVFTGSNGSQSHYQIRVFSAAEYGITGFDPATSPASYDSGVVSSAATQGVIGGGLVNNTSYRVYVRTGKLVGTSIVWSSYSYYSFSVLLVPPTAPNLLSLSWDATNQRVIGSVEATGYNMVTPATTGNFENSIGGWVQVGTNTSLTQSSTYAHSGTKSLRLTPIVAGAIGATSPTGLNGFPVRPGITYKATMWLRSVTSRLCQVSIYWYDSTGTLITSDQGGYSSSSTTSFTQYACSGKVAPAGSAYAAIMLAVQTTASTSEYHYIDDVGLTAGNATTATAPGCSYEWLIQRYNADEGLVTVRNIPAFDQAGNAATTFYDYEALRGINEQYYVSLVATFATSGSEVGGATSNSTISATSDNNWWLKAMNNPSVNSVVRVTSEIDESREENLGIFKLDGRSDTIVVAGQLHGTDINFELTTLTAGEFEAVYALLSQQDTLLLQEPYAGSSGAKLQRWIRIVERAWTHNGRVAAPIRIFKLRAVEVGKGY